MGPFDFNYLLVAMGVVLYAATSSGSILVSSSSKEELYDSNGVLRTTSNRSDNSMKSRTQANHDSSYAHVTIFDTSGEGGHSFSVKFPSNVGVLHHCLNLGSEACLSWGTSAKLVVTRQTTGRHSISLTSRTEAQICFDISHQHLYGGPLKKFYPQEKTDINNVAYITADFGRFEVVQGVTERYWYTSSGLNVKVDPESPLFLTQNKEQLCLIANNTFPYPSEGPVQLNYKTCVESRNLREGVRCFFDSYEKPVPPAEVVGSPIWSTWVEFKKNVSQENAIKFFNEIRSHKMRLSVMEIDDDWETCYGSQTFNEKFPDPKAMNTYFYSLGTLAEVRVGAETHDFKLMLRLLDTNSIWGVERWGLRTVIPSVLQVSLHGYGAVLPDMIGGNSYEEKPTKELFIRWIQLNTFLPLIQFSLGPWKFDQETVDITRKFIDLHYEYKDRFLEEFHDLSHPVINPIWWLAPEDEVAQVTDDEFLLGETLLVAPVVEEGAVSRDIYLPAGKWKDANTGTEHRGPTWLRGYSAPLDVLPYFEVVPQE